MLKSIFRSMFNLEMMVRNFYLFTIVAAMIGGVTYFSVSTLWKSVSGIKEVYLPLLNAQQDMAAHLARLEINLERFSHLDSEGDKKALLSSLNQNMTLFTKALEGTAGLPLEDNIRPFMTKVSRSAKALPHSLESADITAKLLKTTTSTKKAVHDMGSFLLTSARENFSYSETAYGTAAKIIIFLTSIAIAGMLLLGYILSKAVGRPVSNVTDKLTRNANNIETVSTEISEGIKKQTGVVQVAVSDLNIMIKDIIEQKILPSVGKQADMTVSFSDFLRHFVERTSAEIAMGTMSISQQAVDARKSIGELVDEVVIVEENVRHHEKAVGDMVEALKSIVEANTAIKVKADSSTNAADIAASKAVSGQEMMENISTQLQEIRNSSEGVRDIIESLATITESIKILALNMSLKVEDVKDDTGKTYGFEAMSAKVQGLAEEIEKLLSRSKSMMIPTIEGIAMVSSKSAQAKDVIGEATIAIKDADEESKSIAEMIGKQASDIDRVEIEAEHLRALAQKTAEAIGAQGALAKDIDEMLRDSEMLIETVSGQTEESVEGARKVNKMMADMEQTVNSIKEGTTLLTDKSTGISEMFTIIHELAEKNKKGAEQLDAAKRSIRELSGHLSMVVKGTS